MIMNKTINKINSIRKSENYCICKNNTWILVENDTKCLKCNKELIHTGNSHDCPLCCGAPYPYSCECIEAEHGHNFYEGCNENCSDLWNISHPLNGYK